jgi:hypothetical protein
VTAKTAGQQAYEAFYAPYGAATIMPYGDTTEVMRARWEAAAQAAIAARQPQPAPGVTSITPDGTFSLPAPQPALGELEDRLIEAERTIDNYREEHARLAADCERLRGLLNEARIADPQPAPGLAAAMAAVAGKLDGEATALRAAGGQFSGREREVREYAARAYEDSAARVREALGGQP